MGFMNYALYDSDMIDTLASFVVGTISAVVLENEDDFELDDDEIEALEIACRILCLDPAKTYPLYEGDYHGECENANDQDE